MVKKREPTNWEEKETESRERAKKDEKLKVLWSQYDALVGDLGKLSQQGDTDSFLVIGARGALRRQLDNVSSKSLVGASLYKKLCADNPQGKYTEIEDELKKIWAECEEQKKIISGETTGNSVSTTPQSEGKSKSKLQQIQEELKKTEADFFYDLRYLQARLPKELEELKEKYPKQDVSNLRSCLENILKSIEPLVKSSEAFYKAVEKDPFSDEAKGAFTSHLGNFKSPIALYVEYQRYINSLKEAKKSSNGKIEVSQEQGMPPPDQRMVDNTKTLRLFDTLNKFVQRALKYPLLFREMSQATKDDAELSQHCSELLAEAQSTGESINEAQRGNEQPSTTATLAQPTAPVQEETVVSKGDLEKLYEQLRGKLEALKDAAPDDKEKLTEIMGYIATKHLIERHPGTAAYLLSTVQEDLEKLEKKEARAEEKVNSQPAPAAYRLSTVQEDLEKLEKTEAGAEEKVNSQPAPAAYRLSTVQEKLEKLATEKSEVQPQSVSQPNAPDTSQPEPSSKKDAFSLLRVIREKVSSLVKRFSDWSGIGGKAKILPEETSPVTTIIPSNPDEVPPTTRLQSVSATTSSSDLSSVSESEPQPQPQPQPATLVVPSWGKQNRFRPIQVVPGQTKPLEPLGFKEDLQAAVDERAKKLGVDPEQKPRGQRPDSSC